MGYLQDFNYLRRFKLCANRFSYLYILFQKKVANFISPEEHDKVKQKLRTLEHKLKQFNCIMENVEVGKF